MPSFVNQTPSGVIRPEHSYVLVFTTRGQSEDERQAIERVGEDFSGSQLKGAEKGRAPVRDRSGGFTLALSGSPWQARHFHEWRGKVGALGSGLVGLTVRGGKPGPEIRSPLDDLLPDFPSVAEAKGFLGTLGVGIALGVGAIVVIKLL